MTEAEYFAALARASDLMDAEPDSPEEAELVRLAIAIEEYEAATEDWIAEGDYGT